MVKKGVLLLVGTGVGLLLAEFLTIASGLAPEVAVISIGRFRYSANPDIGYEPVPDFEYMGRDLKYFEFNDRSNSLGFRDREHSVLKQPDVYRILVIGDSVSMGLYVKDSEDVFPIVVERELRLRGRDVEVINFGVSGYNTQQEVAMLIEKGLAYSPDLVLLQCSLNDIEEQNGGIVKRLRAREQSDAGVERNLLSPLLTRSALYRMIVFRLMPAQLERSRDAREGALARLDQDTIDESFSRLRITAESHGFEVAVVLFPEFRRYKPAQMAHHTRIAELSRRNGFRHLDLQESFVACSWKDGSAIVRDDMHPSALGHRCAGRAIAGFLESAVLR